MGAKKSTVCTSAMSSDRRKTPASSNVSLPTSSRGSLFSGSAASARDRSPGPIFDAQPAHRANEVSLKSSSRVFEVLTRPTFELLRDDGDGVDLDESAARQRLHLNGRTCRTRIAKPLPVDLVHRREMRKIVQINRRLDDITPRCPRCPQHLLQILHHSIGLLDDPPVDNLSSYRIQWNLARGEKKTVDDYSLRVRTDC